MAQGKHAVEYRVTLCKKVEDKIPIITPCTIREKDYNDILVIITRAMRSTLKGNPAGKKYQR